MATPTSSSNRSKRKSTKPVTADKGRTNRARVSTAKTTSSATRSSNAGARVTNASQRTSTGSSRVTGTTRQALPAKSSASDLQRLQTASKTKPTRPAPRPVPKSQSRPALPPGQRGGALVSQGTRRSRAEAKASNAAQGTTGPNRVGRSDARPALPPGKPGGAMTRASAGGALARTARGAASAAAKGAGMAGRVGGALTTALMIPSAIKNIADVAERNRQWDAYKERMGMNKPQAKPNASSSAGRRTGSNNRVANLSVPSSSAGSRAGAAAGTRTRTRSTSAPNNGADWRSRVGSQDVNTLRQGQNEAIRSYSKPGDTRPSQSRPSQTTPSSRTASGTGGAVQRSTSPKATKPAMPGRKFEDFNPGRGTSKSNNPLLDRDSGGMKLRDRMKQREDSQRSENTKNLKNNFGQDSGYETKTKVDGSKYADKKPDMKKVNEYDRRKRRYYD